MKPQMTVGSLAEALEAFGANLPVVVDCDGTGVDYVCSYRGWYEDLALMPPAALSHGHALGVRMLRRVLLDVVGSLMHGYKGGEYVMGADTLVWRADYGQADGRYICGVSLTEEGGGSIVLETADSEAEHVEWRGSHRGGDVVQRLAEAHSRMATLEAMVREGKTLSQGGGA